MKISKVLAGTLALAMLLAVAACGSKQETEASYTVNEGILTMATSADFPPYEFYEGDSIVGIDAEIAGAIAGKLGLELQIADIDFESVVMSVETGMYDMAMAGLTVTDDRLEQVNFTVSYAKGVQVIIVPDDSPITSADDLFEEGAFHTIGVQLNTTGDLYSTWDLEDEGLASIERFTRGTDAIMALVAGRVDAVIIDNEPARAFVNLNPGLKILETEFAEEDYAIALNKDNTLLLDKVNEALSGLIADGTVKTIVEKYIKSE